MAPFVAGIMRALADALALPGPVVEYGSYRGGARAGDPDLRPLFPGKVFLGVDARPGRGVDLVAPAEALPIADRSVGTFIALNALQHVGRFWLALEHIRRVLRPDGVIILCMPFHERIAGGPSDYWRFAPDGFDLLLEDYTQRLLGWQGTPKRPLHVWAAGFGPYYPLLSGAQLGHLRRCLGEEAREPLPFLSRVRAGLARWLSGGRAAEASLFRNEWGLDYRGPDAASALAA